MAKINNDNISVELDLKAQKAQEEIHRLIKATDELRKQNQAYRREKASLERVEGDHTKEYKRLNDAIAENTRKIEANKRAMEAEREKIDISRMTAAQLGKELKNLKRELANTSKATKPEQYRKLEDNIRRVEKAYAEATRSSRGFLASLLSLDKIATSIKGFFMGLGMVITTQVIGALKQLTTTIIDFERSNSKLAAVLGTTIEGVSRLTEQAKFLGRTTTATATQVTGLQTELAKLGFSQDVIEKLTPATLKFAKAVDTDLSSAAAFAGAAMRMFNKDASDAEGVMATFAVATTKSALDFSKLQASLSTVGPVANAFGFSVEETTALLGQLSNAGFDASSAATATRNILLNLADANGDLAQALGAPVTNLDGLVNGLRKLNSEGVDLAKALELTDKRSVAAFQTFLDGADNISALRDSITDCTGDFNAMSQTMADNAAGSYAGFQSALEGLVLKFFDFREALKTMFEWATALVNWIGSFVDALNGTGAVLAAVAGTIGGMIAAVGQLVRWFTDLFTQTKWGRVAINGVVAALVAYKVATLACSTAVKTFVKGITAKVAALAADGKSLTFAAVKQWALNAAMNANPIIALITLLVAVTAAVIGYNSTVDDAVEKTDSWSEANEEASKQYGAQKGKIEALIMVAENENLSLKRRLKAVADLNRIIPGYNAKIDETTGKYTASKEALDAYLASLEKEMRYKANAKKMEELAAAAEGARDAYDEAQLAAADAPEYLYKWYGRVYNGAPRKAAREAKAAWDQAEKDFQAFKTRMKKAVNDGIITPPESSTDTSTVDKPLNRPKAKVTGAAVDAEIEKIKALKKELKDLRKTEASTMEEYRNIEARKEQIREQLKAQSGKGKNKKNRRTPGTYSEDSINEATAPVDDAHQQRLLEINMKRNEMTENEYMVERSKEMIKYYEDLDKALADMAAKTDATHTQTLDKIQAERNSYALKSAEENRKRIKAETALAQEEYENRLEATNAFYDEQARIIKEETNGNIEMAEAAAVYLSEIERNRHRAELAEMERRYDELEDIGEMDLNTWLATRKKLAEEMKKKQNEILNDTGAWAEKMRELSVDTTSRQGITAAFDLRRSQLEATYDAAIKIARKEGEDTVGLETEKQRRIAALNFQYQEQMWQLQELTGLSWAQEYDRELEKLEEYHRQGLIDEKDYQKKRLQMGVDNAKKYFDYYAQLSGSMFTAIQDAEIAKSDAKFDVLIQQAKNNGEDTAALEEEKENKKLGIQKKYADVNFAIKVSQIIADTAVAIMKAFADLGPIGGAIAAAMLTATGAAQVVSANAERQKIKNMSPGNTAGNKSSDTPATAERVLSGYADGGYTGDGGRYEIAGVVHRGEYVIPKPIMDNPRVIDAVGTIEAIRRSRIAGARSIPAPSTGFADGGFTGPASPVDMSDLVAATRELCAAAANIRAHVVLTDLDRAQSDRARARAPFTRKR